MFSFIQSIQDFPLLLYTYNDGLIIGSNLTYSHNFNSLSSKHVNLIRIFGDESGLLFGEIFKNKLQREKHFQTFTDTLKLKPIIAIS